MKRALITGITGQDGSYLAELLLSKGYEVHGIVRRSSSINTSRIDHLFKDPHENNLRFHLHYGDLVDTSNLLWIISTVKPHEIYNLAAQSHVKVSFEVPAYTANVNANGTLNILEAIRTINPKIKFYQASTSELYGKVQEVPQSETTPFYPRSPYGVSKLYSYWIVKNYRESYGLFASNGILFNHESERRGETFVTKKITKAAVNIAHNLQDCVYLGNLNAKRDWGYAKDYVEGMWKILQHKEADDFVLATGEMHTVREFCELAFQNIGIELCWVGEEENEVGINKNTGKVIIKVDPKYYRPAEVDELCGDLRKAKKLLKWQPKTKFEKLIKIMVDNDEKQIKK